MTASSDDAEPVAGSATTPGEGWADADGRAASARGWRRQGAQAASLLSMLRHQLLDAQAWQMRAARLHGRAGRLASAEAGYRKVLARHPYNFDALTSLGQLLLRERRYGEAVTIWQAAAAARPQALGPVFQLARALHRDNQLEQAADQYLRALALDPTHDKAFLALEQLSHRLARSGRSSGSDGEANAATRISRQLLALRPGSERARQSAEATAKTIVAAASAIVSKSPDIALAQFNAALRLAPDLREALRGTARCLERLGREEEALAVWDQMASENPTASEPPLQKERLRAVIERRRNSKAAGATAALHQRQTILARARRIIATRSAGAEDGVEPLLRLARSAYNAGRLAEAEAGCHRVLAMDALNLGALSLLSRRYLRQQRWADAAAVLTRLDALQPASVAPKEMLARALLQDGQFEGAARVYEELVHLEPDSPEVLATLGRVYGRLRDWNSACRVLRRLVELDPSRAASRLAYGHALQRAGKLDEAERELQSVLAANPREGDALALLGRIRSKNDPEGAFECWARLAELKRQAVEPPLQMARIRLRQHRTAEAAQCFRAVLELDADHAEALAGLGHAVAESDRDEAIGIFTRWAERRPDLAAPWLEIARLHQKAHEWDRAEAIYRQILERDPHNQEALSRFAQLVSRDRVRIDQALLLWRQFAELDPAAAFPIVQRAALFEHARRFAEAEAEYRIAIARAPSDPMPLIGLARLLSNQMRWGEAAELFEGVHRLNPERSDALLGLGRCRERLDRADDALAAYQKILAIEPANANALLYRGRLLRQLGRVDEAIGEWRRVCRIAPRNADAWHELVFMLASAERESEALAALDQAEAALGASPQASVRLGLTAEAAQFHDRAVAYFERAIASEPQQASHHAQLGFYYFRQGIVDGAFHHLLDSRERHPPDLQVAKRLVEAVHIVNECGIDHIALRRAPRTCGDILLPERLFAMVRRIADSAVAPYDAIPRRIIAISASLAAGGAERQLVNMLRGLAEPRFQLDLALFCISLSRRTRRDFFRPMLEGIPVDLLVPDEGGAEAYLRLPEVAPYAQLIRRFPEDMVGPIALWLAEFRRRRPQVVHAWQDSTNLTAAVAALLAGVPRIVLCTRSVRPDNPRRRLKRFMKEAYQALLGHPSVILSNNSRAGANDYADWLGLDPAKIEIVHNGIDFDALERSIDPAETRRARASLAIPADAPVLGSAFRMSEEKRPVLWVEVAAAVARGNAAVHFIVCGDGPMRNDMRERAAELGIADRVHLPGPQSNIASWYKAMDVVMLTSRHEGLPNVLLEAQSLGIPVVAPDVGGMGEVVWQGVTGWAVPLGDAESLAERVLFSLGDQAWRQRALVEAPPFVRERFGMPAMLRRNLEVYGIGDAA